MTKIVLPAAVCELQICENAFTAFATLHCLVSLGNKLCQDMCHTCHSPGAS